MQIIKTRTFRLYLLLYTSIVMSATIAFPLSNSANAIIHPQTNMSAKTDFISLNANSFSVLTNDSNSHLSPPYIDTDPIPYHIANSPLTLFLRPDFSEPSFIWEDLSACIFYSALYVTSRIDSRGRDTVLRATDNPFLTPKFPDVECKFTVWSLPGPDPAGGGVMMEHVTYGVVSDIVRGLKGYMWTPLGGGHLESVGFVVEHTEWGSIGTGRFSSQGRID